jgi:transcriptional regulator with XRE-family HTH domain
MDDLKEDDLKQSERIKHIGRELRRLRLKHNPQKLTLQEVADAVGYSTATLSQIERGVIAPSIQGLLKLADFYKVSPASFFKDKDEGSVVITTPGDREKIPGDFNEVFEVMYNDTGLDAVIMRGIVPPGASSGQQLHKRDYSEFVYVAKGSIKVITEGKESEIKAGDSAFIEANTPFMLSVDGKDKLEGVFIYFGKR